MTLTHKGNYQGVVGTLVSITGETGETRREIVPATQLVDASGAGYTAGSPVPASATARLLSAAASTNATVVKASPGTLMGVQGYNARASAVYLKIYNKASAPTVGTDTPVKTIYLPASTPFALQFNNSFSLGIAFALTTGAPDADTGALTAGDILGLNIDYA